MAGISGAFGDALNRKYANLEANTQGENALREAQATGITDAIPSENRLRNAQAGAAGASAFAQTEAAKTVQPLAQSQIGLQQQQGGFLGAQAGQINEGLANADDATLGNLHIQTTQDNYGLNANTGLGVARRPGYTYGGQPSSFSAGTPNVKGAPMAPAPLPPPGAAPMQQGMGLFDHMHGIVTHAMHALHAAGGMANVPSPGQTTSSGSWEGPQPTQGTPMNPPAPTPNQDLRAKMGYGVKASGGMSDVPSGTPPIADPVRYPDPNPQPGFGTRKSLTGTLQASEGATKVPGKGNPGVDKVPAVLAPGEAVLNQGAAMHMGRGAIAALNALGAHSMAMAGTPPQGPGADPATQQGPMGAPPMGGSPMPAPDPKAQKPLPGRGMPKMGGMSKPVGKSAPPSKAKAPMSKGKVAAGGKGR